MYDFICENGRVGESGLEALLNSKVCGISLHGSLTAS